MLMNDGVDPVSGSTIVSSDIIAHAANGVSVSSGMGDYPELVSVRFIFITKPYLYSGPIQSPQVYGCAQWGFSYHGHDTFEHSGHNPGYHSQV